MESFRKIGDSLSPAKTEVPGDRAQKRARSLSLCSTAQARTCLSYEAARRWRALPLAMLSLQQEQLLTLAIPERSEGELLSTLRFATGRQVKLIAVPAEIIDEAIYLAYQGDAGQIVTRVTGLKRDPEQQEPHSPDVVVDFRRCRSDVAELLRSVIDYGIAREASDIHLIPTTEGTILRVRIGGELYTFHEPLCGREYHEQIINRIKVLCSLDTTIRQLPQDGSFLVPLERRRAHIRVSTLPTIHGEKAVLRILAAAGVRPLDELGLIPPARELLSRQVARGEGMILFAGPTGSGKTTSMYALLDLLRKRDLNIVTIEDPVEIHLEGVSQTSVQEKVGLTYARSIRAVLRQDPDVILVGEIRDADSAGVAFQAALTGHLVISTVHARSVLEALSRVSSLGVDPLTMAQAIGLLVCQKLAPQLCERCKVIDLAASAAWGEDVYQAAGCPACDRSGHVGQLLVAEMLEMHENLYRVISHGELASLVPTDLPGDRYLSMAQWERVIIREGKIGASPCA